MRDFNDVRLRELQVKGIPHYYYYDFCSLCVKASNNFCLNFLILAVALSLLYDLLINFVCTAFELLLSGCNSNSELREVAEVVDSSEECKNLSEKYFHCSDERCLKRFKQQRDHTLNVHGGLSRVYTECTRNYFKF